MCLHHSYKQEQITKAKLIHGHHNQPDSMTKVKPLLVLKTLIETNCINISTTRWVEQASKKQANTENKQSF